MGPLRPLTGRDYQLQPANACAGVQARGESKFGLVPSHTSIIFLVCFAPGFTGICLGPATIAGGPATLASFSPDVRSGPAGRVLLRAEPWR